jgi:hypothetical protein
MHLVEVMAAGNQTEFSRRIGVNQSTFHGYLSAKGQDKVKAPLLERIVKEFSVDPVWLVTGVGMEPRKPVTRPGTEPYMDAEAFRVLSDEAGANKRTYDPRKPWRTVITGPPGADALEHLSADRPVGVVTSASGAALESGRLLEYGAVPRASAQLSAGLGLEPDMGGLGLYAFRHDWLIRACDPAKCVLMEVAGNSMEPDLRDKDLVLVDASKTEIVPGKLYALAINGLNLVKRLDVKPGKIILRSSNPAYETYEIEPDLPGVRILGRVVWIGREA